MTAAAVSGMFHRRARMATQSSHKRNMLDPHPRSIACAAGRVLLPMNSSITARQRVGSSTVSANTSTNQLNTPRQQRGTPTVHNAEERVRNALRIVATLLEHDEAYLPIFLRLETELQALERKRDALDRARAMRLHVR